MDIPVKHMALDYFPEFKCLADKCNYTCCQGWTVGLLRNEYMKTKNLHSTPEIEKKLKTGLKRFPKNDSDKPRFYAEIVMNEQGVCPFLTEGHMCELQIEHGYNVLSHTCKIFPRMKKGAPTQWEECCTLGCEQVVNLLLERPQGVRLIEIHDEKNATINSEFRDKWFEQEPRAMFYRECQLLFMGILQNRRYSLHHRMLLMGFAVRDLDKCKTKEETLAFLQKSLSLLEHDPKMEQMLKEIPVDTMAALQVTLMPVLLADESVFYESFKDKIFREMLKDVKRNLKIEKREEIIEDEVKVQFVCDVPKYLAAKKHFESFEYAEYLLENVMVNTMIQQQFPLQWAEEENSVETGYLKMCAAYNIFKILTIGYVADKEEPKDVVHAITCCARAMLHYETYHNQLVKFLGECGKNNLLDIAQFLGG